jgi:hypothetical protein
VNNADKAAMPVAKLKLLTPDSMMDIFLSNASVVGVP